MDRNGNPRTRSNVFPPVKWNGRLGVDQPGQVAVDRRRCPPCTSESGCGRICANSNGNPVSGPWEHVPRGNGIVRGYQLRVLRPRQLRRWKCESLGRPVRLFNSLWSVECTGSGALYDLDHRGRRIECRSRIAGRYLLVYCTATHGCYQWSVCLVPAHGANLPSDNGSGGGQNVGNSNGHFCLC